MPSIASLGFNVTANTSGFSRGMSKARTSLKKFEDDTKKSRASVSGFATSLKKLGAAFVGSRIFRSFTSEVEQQTSMIDTLAKTSRKLGLSVTALDELRHAAGLAGIQSNTLDMALQRLTRRVAEAAMGTGEAKGALIELGLSAKTLAGLPADKQLLAIADAMKSLKTQSDKVRLAFKLFDSEGVALVNLLGDGSEGVRTLTDDLKRFRNPITEKDAKTAEDFRDSVKRLGQAWDGFKRSLLFDSGEVGGLTVAFDTISGFVSGLSTSKSDRFVTRLKEATTQARKGFEGMESAISQVSADDKLAAINGELQKMLDLQKKNEERAKAVATAFKSAAEGLRGQIGDLRFGDGSSLFNRLADLGASNTQLQHIINLQRELKRQQAFQSGREFTDRFATSRAKFDKKFAEAGKLLRIGAITPVTFLRGISELRKQFAEQNNAERIGQPSLVQSRFLSRAPGGENKVEKNTERLVKLSAEQNLIIREAAIRFQDYVNAAPQPYEIGP